MLEKLAELIKSETGAAVTAETKIEELGIDSLEFLDLLLVIERELGKVPDEKLPYIGTVGALADAIVHPN